MSERLDFNQANPAALKPMRGLEQYIAQSSIEKSLAELVRLRASQINGCAFCVDMHTADARKGGEDERRLATVCVWQETHLFTDRERAALAWTEALTRIATQPVTDKLYDELSTHFSEAERVDLTLLIGSINTWNRFAIAFRKPLP
ncbi:carboxymuconolactone decarboxylase family protein [Amantichitinum ursilacus]|uniref:Alkyl hydroperoxide reductase AhpD n=1 Tax=Amantichitinum ursilacus TaxID=857265 RepID=A0A0N0XNR1_9NEIS|nr:carboxymuconolactone decarboxylase family protein [Amantichitinum ursilacus]KPC55332.1 Alkyl hydroperoxide reductase AhpD [Amantichitinum ursilacus]